MKLPISIAILSWKSPNTLRNTLSSYGKLLEVTDDVSIYFQEVSDTDMSIAEEYNITNILSSSENIGIGSAIIKLVENAKYEHVLFLENDWLLDDSEGIDVYKQLEVGLIALDNGVDFCRYRSVSNPGFPLYTLQFAKDPMASPEHLIEQVHTYGVSLVSMYPDIVKGIYLHDTTFVITDSFYGNYSNNPFMCSKEFYIRHVAPADKGGISLEGEIRKTWREAGHKVAYNIPGLFTHKRVD